MSKYSGVYSILLEGVALTGADTLLEVVVSADQSVELFRIEVAQDVSTTSTMQEIAIQTFSASGTGTAETPGKHNPSSAAAGSTGKSAITVEGAGAAVIYRSAFNILNGWLYLPVPEERFLFNGADVFGVTLIVAPDASTTFNATLTFGEI